MSERFIEQRIREMVDIDAVQFGFMPDKGTTDVIFIARQQQEGYLEKKKKLYFYFLDLKKAFDWVPREVVKWDLRKLGSRGMVNKGVMAM